ncbi:LamG domain-containing protein [Streptomyces sp. NPDC060198]|uniref:LamG domain-containing protein n=1 Tax=Streptomyces sp. NPDC060198 TaxID=3347070 RepID=UPI00365ABC8F
MGRGGPRWLAGAACGAVLALTASGTAVAVDNLPPLKPGAADLSTGPKACTSGPDRPEVTGPPPLYAVLSDPTEDDVPNRGNSVGGEFEAWWTDADGVEQRLHHASSAPLPSGARSVWNTTLGDQLPLDTVISWHVRADDGAAVSEWSDAGTTACEFVIDGVAPQAPLVTSAEFPEDVYRSAGIGTYGTFRFASPSDDDVVSYRYTLLGHPSVDVAATGPDHTADVRILATETTHVLDVEAFDKAGHRGESTHYAFYPSFASAPVAEWQLSDPAGTRSAAPLTGTAARAGTGAVFGAAAPEGTALASTVRLDGTGHGFLTPGAPVVDTTKTFVVGGWVRPGATDHFMTVASQDADGAPAFTLDLRPVDGGAQWSFGTGSERVTGGEQDADRWSYVLGLYDAETGLAHLYVDGKETAAPVAASPAQVTGNFQIGRARGKLGYRDRWQGEIGDLRVYDRVVVPAEITQLAAVEIPRPTAVGQWSMETATGGTTPTRGEGEPLTLEGGASLFRLPDDICDVYPIDCEPPLYPLRGQAHLTLDGIDDYAHTALPAVDTTGNYTLSAFVRLADDVTVTDAPMTLLSQEGDSGTAAFEVRYVPAAGRWELSVAQAGAAPQVTTVIKETAATGTHRVAVVHDARTDRITLYVDAQKQDGVTATLRSPSASTGGLQIGRGPQAAGGWGSYLRGAVDEVRAFSGALSATAVQDLANGYDPCLSCS